MERAIDMKVYSRKTKHEGYFQFQIVGTTAGLKELLRAKDSVSILLFNKESRHIVLVEQARVAMIRDDNPDGLIIELVAGRCDKNMTPQEIAASEAWEEAGVTISPKRIELLNFGIPMAVSAGSTDERAHLMFAEICNADMDWTKEVFGLASENEVTRRILVPINDLETYECRDIRTFALIQYFLKRRALGNW